MPLDPLSALSTLATLVELAKDGRDAVEWARNQIQDRTPTGLYVDAVERVLAGRRARFERDQGYALTFDRGSFQERLKGAGIDLLEHAVFAPSLDLALKREVGALLLHDDVLLGAGIPGQVDRAWAESVVAEAHVVYMRTIWKVVPEVARQQALLELTQSSQEVAGVVLQILDLSEDVKAAVRGGHAELIARLTTIESQLGIRLTGPGTNWRRPTPPDRPVAFVQRHDAARISYTERVTELLTSGTRRAALFGGPGLGKSMLAQWIAAGLDDAFPGGVFFEELDPYLTNADSQPILRRWAEHAGRVESDKAISPKEVRDRLVGHGDLLIVLDNVMDAGTVEELLGALPAGSAVLVTTQRLEVALSVVKSRSRTLRIEYLLDDEAIALVSDRLGVESSDQVATIRRLCDCLANHPQALDVAARDLALRSTETWNATIDELEERIALGRGLGLAALPGEDEGARKVRASLEVSYGALRDEAKRRFRWLGALGLEGPFSAAAIGGVWGCSDVEAENQLMALVNRALVQDRALGYWRQHRILRAFARLVLVEAGEEVEAACRHAEVYLARLKRLVDDGNARDLLDEVVQLDSAANWLIDHDSQNGISMIDVAQPLAEQWGLAERVYSWAAKLRKSVTCNGSARAWSAIGGVAHLAARFRHHDRGARLREALDAFDEVLRLLSVGGDPQDCARAQNSRGNVLSDLAGMGGEDREARLHEALEAYDVALQYYTPQTEPQDYARTQNNRGNVLKDLAGVGGEDRRARLREALDLYDEALRFVTPEAAPQDFATMQNNRGNVLSHLAGVGDEDRGARLREALEAYDEALRFRTAEAAPQDYATTQNNRGLVLLDMAGVGGEDRGARLREALGAFDETLRFHTAKAAPQDYAVAQNNRGVVLRTVAGVGDEDRWVRLRDALGAFDEAQRFHTAETAPRDYAMTQSNRGNVLGDLAEIEGEDRWSRLLEALEAHSEALRHLSLEAEPQDYARTQFCRGNVLSDLAGVRGEDRRMRLREALEAYDEALRYFTPRTAPRDNFATQINRGSVLRDLSVMRGEDRRARLCEALWAFDEALSLQTAEATSQEYALTQINRAPVLRDLSVMRGEDRETRLREALGAWEEALRLSLTVGDQDGEEYCLVRVADVQVMQREFARAVETINRAISLTSTPPPHLLRIRAGLYVALKDSSSALKDLVVAAEEEPESAYLAYQQGEVAQLLEQYPEALEQYGLALKREPSLAHAWFRKAEVYLLSGDPASARASYEQGLSVVDEPGDILSAMDELNARLRELAGVPAVRELRSFLEGAWLGWTNRIEA